MNWAIPRAPFGDTASCRKVLSFQISLVKKSIEMPLASAACSINSQIVCGVGSSGAPATFAPVSPACTNLAESMVTRNATRIVRAGVHA